ncbi:MAG: Capsular polysaccharide export system protein KpsS [Panacagrimonas sp.]|jgi:capsular polysaccharide export protein|nr:hypothetical protein [Panacagrimonas sp.]MCC2656680.1 Capsular polysaccharide export system protein KpsS [Panacagrimonas sp.]
MPRNSSTPAAVLGIKPWKRWQIDRFIGARFQPLTYCSSAAAALRVQARTGGPIVVWASREPDELSATVAARGGRLIRMEDGFLRSVGLGSNHVGGASLVLDESGIYFDPRRPSSLETMLSGDAFDPALLERAARLRRRLVDAGLTKYNVGRSEAIDLGGADDRLRLLVPGQVEDDASVRFGASGVRTNLELLRAVRESHPQARIVYKPHPDTEAGTRAGAIPDAAALKLADRVVRGCSVTALLPQVDRVHTMTSLVGFEALLRGVAVTTWGQPFYAGWGLTEDRLAHPRRTRRVTLDELVAASLIRYPLYVHPDSGLRCEVEDLVDWLALRAREGAAADPSAVRRTLRLCRGWLRSLGLGA